jgi:hypothetical protein
MINKSNQKLNAWGRGGEMNQALYAHINNKRKMKKKCTYYKIHRFM